MDGLPLSTGISLPQLNDNLFAFTPPQGAEKIKFIPVQTGQAPKPKPEKKKKGGKS